MGVEDRIFDNAIQEELPGLELPSKGPQKDSPTSASPIQTNDPEEIQAEIGIDNTNYPTETTIEEKIDVLSRGGQEGYNFSVEAREELFHELASRAKGKGLKNMRGFLNVNRNPGYFALKTQPHEDKKLERSEDPYYTYPKKVTKGLTITTKEIVNTGGGWEWEVSKRELIDLAGGRNISWEFSNTKNPRSK